MLNNTLIKILVSSLLIIPVLYFGYGIGLVLLSKHLAATASIKVATFKQALNLPALLVIVEVVVAMAIVYYAGDRKRLNKQHSCDLSI